VSLKIESLLSQQLISGAQLAAGISSLCSFLTISVWKREMEEINASPNPISHMQQVVNGTANFLYFPIVFFLTPPF
jgi:hypothetical protein